MPTIHPHLCAVQKHSSSINQNKVTMEHNPLSLKPPFFPTLTHTQTLELTYWPTS